MLVEIHGGGLQAGKKSDNLPLTYHGAIEQAFDDHGVAVVSINYPLVQNTDEPPALTPNLFPVPHASVQLAVQFVRSKAAAWNLDPERIYAIGSSAGGNLASWVAMSADARDPTAPAGSVASHSSRLAGIVPYIAPTMFTQYHQKGNAERLSLWNMFGAATEAEYLQVPIATTYEASAGWVAQYGGPGLAPAQSAAVSKQNRRVPVYAVYAVEDPADTCSLDYALPTLNPHSKVFGLLLAEAFSTDYGLPPYDQPPIVSCLPSLSAPTGWDDLSFYLSPNGLMTPADKANLAAAISDWLGERIARPLAKLVPDPAPMPVPFLVGWHVNLGSTAASDFVAGLLGQTSDDQLRVAILLDGDPVFGQSYAGLVSGPLAPVFDVDATGNTIDIELLLPVDLQALGVGTMTSAILVEVDGETVLEVGTYTG